MGTIGELLMELLGAAVNVLGITFGVLLICAALSPLLPVDMQDKLRCPRCYFVGNPENFKIRPFEERLQESRTDCGRDHCPCPCGKGHDK